MHAKHYLCRPATEAQVRETVESICRRIADDARLDIRPRYVNHYQFAGFPIGSQVIGILPRRDGSAVLTMGCDKWPRCRVGAQVKITLPAGGTRDAALAAAVEYFALYHEAYAAQEEERGKWLAEFHRRHSDMVCWQFDVTAEVVDDPADPAENAPRVYFVAAKSSADVIRFIERKGLNLTGGITRIDSAAWGDIDAIITDDGLPIWERY